MALYIGLMSGTSLDGVDGALADFSGDSTRTLAAAYIPFPAALRSDLMALQSAGHNEIEREALAANALAARYADCVAALLAEAGVAAGAVRAIGAHGQTIRHRPELGFTRQSNNPALLAELSGIDVIADFRSRDVAAGGQGAPLVPAFHQAQFGKAGQTRVVANIGGISNISVLHGDGAVSGFDTGPGNALMDAWTARHLGRDYDADGAWAAGGKEIPALLAAMLAEPYFALPAPKSTGRDLFHPDWLAAMLAAFPAAAPTDVQFTLTRLTALTLAQAIRAYGAQADAVYICGGGAYNGTLMRELAAALDGQATVASTAALGVPPNRVEALAFAWLAQRFTQRADGNLAAVTGARGGRVLGALYPR
ncbi:anhydro-N-acetylmuramic acid kinase [Janthinobacterium fluminis]|uniref:Anhydro-N-acetylmuramic acid kinase n=1 Tax=Janthinobacterium fluminis TaxID=2987524 RepID=A0ABT5K3Z1_9BURK|nr:anhydro-N-acetylmuramic acid kinase [Janthinobacterium fluminis]MDC8759712.1 anhydro-N-acetylmuramic acid kinase [Janthinobacterium fluminis]